MTNDRKQFVVLQGVPGDGLVNTMDVLPQCRQLDVWETQLIERARNSRVEWLADYPSFGSGNSLRSDWWKGDNHQLAVLDSLPGNGGINSPEVVATLYPGTTIEALEYFRLDSNTFHNIGPSCQLKADNEEEDLKMIIQQCKMGTLQMIKMEYSLNEDETRHGYVVYSIDGYNFLAFGTAVENSAPWYWRVTCPHGAWIRSGPSLSSDKLSTIPYGALVQVHGKVLNDMALSRLQVQYNKTWGWCSEFLNPLSGQRGPILQPMPLLTPLAIQVCWPNGALVRESIELSSPSKETIHCNEFVTITSRVFSEYPRESCIQRLRLADGTGWISQCLNTKAREPIIDEITFRAVRSYNPLSPGEFHLEQLPNLPDVHDEAASPRLNKPRDKTTSSRPDPPTQTNSDSTQEEEDNLCVVCLTAERNATIVHNETGHIACCLVCARILRARGDGCPVCRQTIDLVIQHFHA